MMLDIIKDDVYTEAMSYAESGQYDLAINYLLPLAVNGDRNSMNNLETYIIIYQIVQALFTFIYPKLKYIPLEYVKLRNHNDYEMREYFRCNDITLLVNDYDEIKFTKIVDYYGLDEFYRKPTEEKN